MGMFDYVNFKKVCECGAVVTDFQSKDRECGMYLISPEDTVNFYSSCGACGRWHEYSRGYKYKIVYEEIGASAPPPMSEAAVEILGFTCQVGEPRKAKP